MTKMFDVRVNGILVSVPVGTTAAAAIIVAGRASFRRSVSGEPRGPVCGMGVCFECRVTIDGVPHRLSCQVPAREGMAIVTE